MNNSFAPPTEQAARWEWLITHLTDAEIRVLYQAAFRILKNKDDTDDVMQEALIKGAINCGKLKDPSKLFSWMYTIVRNEALCYQCKNNLQTIWLQAKLKVWKPFKEESAEHFLLEKYQRAQLAEAIKMLKYPAKDILLMRIVEEKSFIQIAQELGLNYHTVRSRYLRTIKELRRELEENGDE